MPSNVKDKLFVTKTSLIFPKIILFLRAKKSIESFNLIKAGCAFLITGNLVCNGYKIIGCSSIMLSMHWNRGLSITHFSVWGLSHAYKRVMALNLFLPLQNNCNILAVLHLFLILWLRISKSYFTLFFALWKIKIFFVSEKLWKLVLFICRLTVLGAQVTNNTQVIKAAPSIHEYK